VGSINRANCTRVAVVQGAMNKYHIGDEQAFSEVINMTLMLDHMNVTNRRAAYSYREAFPK
jgi:hypothetical protein